MPVVFAHRNLVLQPVFTQQSVWHPVSTVPTVTDPAKEISQNTVFRAWSYSWRCSASTSWLYYYLNTGSREKLGNTTGYEHNGNANSID